MLAFQHQPFVLPPHFQLALSPFEVSFTTLDVVSSDFQVLIFQHNTVRTTLQTSQNPERLVQPTCRRAVWIQKWLFLLPSCRYFVILVEVCSSIPCKQFFFADVTYDIFTKMGLAISVSASLLGEELSTWHWTVEARRCDLPNLTSPELHVSY